jgi:hypothetical protein
LTDHLGPKVIRLDKFGERRGIRGVVPILETKVWTHEKTTEHASENHLN